jgi:tRNA(Ile)-lysidine synthase
VLAHTKREPTTRHAAVCWAGAELRRYRDRLVMLDPASPVPVDWEATWDPATVLLLPGGLQLRAEARPGTGISPARIAGRALRVTMRRGGERCLLRGHHHKVKKLLQAAGIPPWERERLPLVYVDGELAAIGAYWVCDSVAARGDEPGLACIVERADARPSG